MAHHPKKKPKEVKQSTKEKLKQIKKENKLKLKEKRAKLIVRNLPFQVTEENLKAHFEKFGEIDNVKILKKEDGKLVGCGFIQFKFVQKAAKAKHHTNGQPFLGRNLDVDFALAKNKYEKNKKQAKKAEEEEEVEIKEEPIDPDEIKEEPIEDDHVEKEEGNESDVKEDETQKESIAEEQFSSSGDESDDIKEEDENDNDSVKEIETEVRPKVQSHDVSEGKTIFIKNVPFTATNDDLRQCMLQFGPVYYALICIDKLTEHSKGTAFVKFRELEDAEKALSAGTELTLLGNVLDCHRALDRSEIQRKSTQKFQEKQAPKDSRNLYLVKEGVILAGSKAAEGVSAADMAKRLQIEQYKTQMLRNLNMFISRERLVIHNVPSSWDDIKLRALFQKHSHKNAVIREVRIMRDLRNVDANGLGQSKEFGFVSFTNHEDALNALRSLNNNPKIFSPNKRPIVTFSIENKSMIKAKQKRLEKSRQKNPVCKDFDPKKVEDRKNKNQIGVRQRNNKSREENQQEFTGVSAKPGPQKLRSKFKLSTQAKLHYENLKKEKKKKKFAKKTLAEKQKEFIKQPQQKINKKRKHDDDNFSKIVAEYKKKLTESPVTKSKWFE